MDIKEEVYAKAVKVLEKCVTSHGFHAASPGYQGVWSRDSVIMSLGASLIGSQFKKVFSQSLITLGNNQSKKGQIPNAVLYGQDKGKVDYKSIDSTLWFIIGHYLYKKRYSDSSLFNKEKKKIASALNWLSYQDMGEDHLLEQGPTSDWQDAFPHRYGHTINTQALWYHVLNLTGNNKEAKNVKKVCNENKEDGLWDTDFYYSYRWKNHNAYQEKSDWFDSLGNFLAIVFELADKNKAEKIINYVEKMKINKPYPVKVMYPPIQKGSKYWYDYFNDAECRDPWHYSNSGIWTFVGCFYILSLIKLGYQNEAEKQLEKIAEANLKKPEFSEWLHGKTGNPEHLGEKSGNQGWNAGMYVLAYESLKKRKVLI